MNKLKNPIYRVSFSSYLVHEIPDGEPVCYKGYRGVSAGAKALEDIMGSGTLQTAIIEYLLRIFFKNPDERHLRIITNEGGLHLDKRNNLAGVMGAGSTSAVIRRSRSRRLPNPAAKSKPAT